MKLVTVLTLAMSVILAVLVAVFAVDYFNAVPLQADPAKPGWRIGEIGDFLGGTLGAIAFLILVATAWMQQVELRDQKALGRQQMALQAFNLVRPDLEDLSREIAKKAGLVVATRSDGSPGKLEEYEQRFSRGERSAFMSLFWVGGGSALRDNVRIAAQRPEKARTANQKALLDRTERYRDLFRPLEGKINETEGGAYLHQALMTTEAGRAYRVIRDALDTAKT